MSGLSGYRSPKPSTSLRAVAGSLPSIAIEAARTIASSAQAAFGSSSASFENRAIASTGRPEAAAASAEWNRRSEVVGDPCSRPIAASSTTRAPAGSFLAIIESPRASAAGPASGCDGSLAIGRRSASASSVWPSLPSASARSTRASARFGLLGLAFSSASKAATASAPPPRRRLDLADPEPGLVDRLGAVPARQVAEDLDRPGAVPPGLRASGRARASPGWPDSRRGCRSGPTRRPASPPASPSGGPRGRRGATRPPRTYRRSPPGLAT